MSTTTQMTIAKRLSELIETTPREELLTQYQEMGWDLEMFISDNDGSMLCLWQNKADGTPLFVSLHRGHDQEYIEVFPSVGAWELL